MSGATRSSTFRDLPSCLSFLDNNCAGAMLNVDDASPIIKADSDETPLVVRGSGLEDELETSMEALHDRSRTITVPEYLPGGLKGDLPLDVVTDR